MSLIAMRGGTTELSCVLSFLVLPLLPVATLASTSATTLTYVNRSADFGQQLLLRRDGERLVIVDDRSHAIVASASATATQHVVVRGADGQDDMLTVDLSIPFSLAGGIDYDGGAGGWDTLVITGGSICRETVTQLTPHDGVFNLDGLILRYTNLEPTIDTVAAASLTVNGTAGKDTVTISDGPGAGQATISSPTFESYTFSNKTNVIFDGLGGGDSITLNNPTTPTGLSSFILQNVGTVGQTAPFRYPAFGISATDRILLQGANNVDNIEIVTQNGDIYYNDIDAVTIGGVSSSLSGLRTLNDQYIILFTAGGTITLADTDGIDVIHSERGSVHLVSTSDIVVAVNRPAVTAPAGSITLEARRDLLLGTAGPGFANDVRASSFVFLYAGHNLIVSGSTHVASDDFGTNTGQTAGVAADYFYLQSDSSGGSPSFGSNGTAGASTEIYTRVGLVSLTANNASALFSKSGHVKVEATRLIIASGSGISALSGYVLLSAINGVGVDLGSTTDNANEPPFVFSTTLEISDAEVHRIYSPRLIVESSNRHLDVTQPITFSGALTLRSAGTFDATGAGSLSAPSLTFEDIGSNARMWTINATGVTISPGGAIPYSAVANLNASGGSASDIFNVTPSSSTTITIDGNAPAPPASPGDALNVNTAGTTSPFLTYTSSANGFTGSYTFGNRAPVNFGEIETLNAMTDLGITKTDGVTTATPGTTVTYSIVASNAGPIGISGATVVDTFPAIDNVTWTCSASPGSACNPVGAGGLNQLVDLAVGGTATFSVMGMINPAATSTLTNSVTIGPPAGTSDPNGSNNTATDMDTLTPVADLSVTKTPSQSTYSPRENITYIIVLTNSGPSNAATVLLTDALPPDTTFASLSVPGGFSCATPAVGMNGAVSCTAPTLAVSSSLFTLVVNVRSSAVGNITNTVTATTTSSDPNGATASSTVTSAALIPVMSPGMLLLLAAAIGIAAVFALRRLSV